MSFVRAYAVGVSMLALGCATAGHAQTADQTNPNATGQPAPPAVEQATGTDPVAADESPEIQDGGPGAATSGDIVVTGSRIATNGNDRPTPVTVISAETLVASQPATLAAAVNNLPALVATGGPASTTGTQANGQNFLNLRGLGQVRTLVLLDGRRFVSSTPDSRVDVNLFPAGLVQRVEVVTGGASAAYGSDAVAGVVNFVLDKKYTGLKGEATSGLSSRHDNSEQRVSLTGGTSFADGRGHLLLSGEYYTSAGVESRNRRFRREGGGILTVPGATPARVIVPAIRTTATFGGLVTGGNGGTAAANAAFQGIQFGPGGTLLPYDYGTQTVGRGTASGTQVGGDGINTSLLSQVVRPLERVATYAYADFDVTDRLKVFAEGNFGYTNLEYDVFYNINNGAQAFNIGRDNAYLPAELRQRMVDTGVTSLSLVRYESERGNVTSTNRNWTWRALGGVSGKIGTFDFEASYQHGENVNRNPIFNNQIGSRIQLAVDAVRGPDGQVACRSTLAGAANGCVPYNPFGVGAPSEAALDYVNGTTEYRQVTKQDFAAVSLSGTLFDGWAGPVGIAIGGEYRRDAVDVQTNLLSQQNAYRLGNANPWRADYNVKEGFAELVLPLAKDMSWADSLEFNGAFRYADYSTSGGATTWKAGISYAPIPDIRFRITRSRDFRAPNLNELFSPGRQLTLTVTDPFNNNVRVPSLPSIPAGNPTLAPEIGNTLVAGFVFEPSFLRRFSVSVDYYDIKVRDAIEVLSGQSVLDQCFTGTAALCGFIRRNPAGQLTSLVTPYFNYSEQETRGVDVEAAYAFDIGASRLSLRNLIGYVDKFTTRVPGAGTVDRVGEIGVYLAPTYPSRWRVTSTANLEAGPYTLFLQGRYIGRTTLNALFVEGVDINRNHVSPQFYLDGQIGFKLGGRGNAQLFLNVQNILDHQPPLAPVPSGLNQTTNQAIYDPIGRMFRLGARFSF